MIGITLQRFDEEANFGGTQRHYLTVYQSFLQYLCDAARPLCNCIVANVTSSPARGQPVEWR
jgi:hypothetical protein